MSLQKFFKSKVNRFLTALGAISIATGAFGVSLLISTPVKKTQAVDEQTCSFGHIYLELTTASGTWGSNTTDNCTYIAWVADGSATGQDITLGSAAGGAHIFEAVLPASARGYGNVYIKRCNASNTSQIWNQGQVSCPANGCYNYFLNTGWSSFTVGNNSDIVSSKAVVTEYRNINGTVESNSFRTEYALNGGTGYTWGGPSEPTAVSGYEWDGSWYTDSECNTYLQESDYIVKKDLTLYAWFSPLTTFAVTEYEVVNGTLNSTKIATEYATYGVNFTPTDIAKSGYSLIGWYTDSACTTAYTATTWTAAGNLYAKYAQQYTVTKKAVVGVNPIDSGTETALYGVAFNPTAPSITGFTVSGWYTNQACTTAYVASATAITSVTTLYAKMTASSSFTLVADTATADFPSGYTNNTDNWSTAKIIYVYCFNASYNSGLVAMTRSTVNGYYTLSISSTWTGVVFCIGSSWPDSSSYWRQSNDVTLTATTGEQGYVITGSTTASSKSGVQKLTTYSNQAASSGRPVYVRNDTALSGSPLVIYKAWNASTPYANARYGLTKAVNGSTTLFSFVLDTAYDSFCITMRYNSTVWSTTGAITYAFNTIDSSNPAVLSLTAVASSTYSRIVFNWLSLYQTTNGSSDTYVSAPLPGSSFFRFWISRPSGAFNGDNDVSYEAGYLWSLTVNNGGVTTEIMPKGYVIDSVYRSTESGKTDLRVFSYYDVLMTYKDCTYRWLCRNSSAASGATVVQVADFSTNSLLTDRSVSTRTGDILFLTYNGGITTSWGTCDYSSVTLLKVVMQGYFTCRSDVLNGYGDFAHIDQTWFSTSTVQYARCTATVNTRSSSTDGSGLMAAASLSDYDYNGGSYSYNGSPSATTSLALKYARMYIPSTNKAWGSYTIFGPIKTNETSSISSTLLIVGCSGGAGFLFIAIIYLISRRKKKAHI
jgi:hypothetical protein